jgi:hypothetical protein
MQRNSYSLCPVSLRDGRFLDFWIFNFIQLNLNWQKKSKTKVEKAFFFIFMSSYPEMSFLVQNKRKSH